MAAVTNGVTTASTTDGTSFASGSFTPAASDLLIAYVVASDTVAAGTMSDSQSLGFTKIASAVFSTSLNTIYLFASNARAAASAMTVTFDCTGDTATGAIINVLRVSGMTKTGTASVLQTTKKENQTTNQTPDPVFGSTTSTNNPTIQCIGINHVSPTMAPPTNWTEQADTSYATPTTGIETNSRDSGFAGTTISWTDTTGANPWAILAAELDSSATVTSPIGKQFGTSPFPNEIVMQAIQGGASY